MTEINFDSLDYLRKGSKNQKRVYQFLIKSNILEKLNPFNPILVGSFPLDIDIEDSDLDIICCYPNKKDFINTLTVNFKTKQNFILREKLFNHHKAVICNFNDEDFKIELFGQSIPSKSQLAYKHLIAEYKILNYFGNEFKNQVIKQKKQGLKTEPAFAKLLNLKGDPYKEILKFKTG